MLGATKTPLHLIGLLWLGLCVTNAVAGETDLHRASVADTCQRIAAKLSSVNLHDCQQQQLELSDGWSNKATPILIKEFAPLPQRQPKGRVLVLGGIHGDEYSSVTITFKWMQTLSRYHSGRFHWLIAPLVNPDGLLRKHSQRMNEHGVDLNRNFPTPNWETESTAYWVNQTYRNPRRYPGPAPLSEPETRWLVRQIEAFSPDVIVTIHAPHGILDFDGPRTAPQRFGNLHLNLLGTYPGSLGNYAGVVKQIPVITIELPSAGIMPSTQEVNRIWMDLVRWLDNNLPAHSLQAGDQDRGVDPVQDQTEPS